MIFKDTTGMALNNPSIFKYINSGYLDYLITYILDSRFREAIGLKQWIKDQLDHPTPEMISVAKSAVKTLGKNATDDDKAVACLNFVIKNVSYIPDQMTWGTSEKWQTAQETLNLGTGDCEDGAILIYCLCRLNGISEDRLLLFAGDVAGGGGHCWLGYRPSEYPLNFVFLDWCYNPDLNSIECKSKYYIQDNRIFSGDSNYLYMWFSFNESKSYSSLRNKFAGVKFYV
jgi:hypothetical protein